MNREIKFRAWDKIRKMMVMVEILDLKKMMAYFVWREGSMVRPRDVRFISLIDGGFLMQYTGMKDSNGKEAYEGDFVEAKAISQDGSGTSIVAQIGWLNERFQFLTKYIEYDYKRICYFRIIGNIYENPELLK